MTVEELVKELLIHDSGVRVTIEMLGRETDIEGVDWIVESEQIARLVIHDYKERG